MINDVVHFVARWQKALEGDERTAHAESLCDFTIECFDTCSDGTAILRQNTIYNLMQDIDPERIERLYSFLTNRKNTIHEQTRMQVASRLAKYSTHRQSALKIAIDVMSDGKVNLDSTGWLSLCTSILHMKPEDIEKNEDFSAADAFSILLEHGFRPNMVNYTAVIRSLCICGEFDKAWSVFDIMRRHEIEPDPVLFATLLDGAKRASSASNIHKLAEDAAQHNAIDVVFLNDLLMSILGFSEEERKRKRSNKQHVQSVPAFGPMLHYYAKVFNLAPLQALIPLDLSAYTEQFGRDMPDDWQMARELFPALDVATSAVQKKLHPTGATLSIMYIAFAKNLAQPIKLISLYAYFRQLILNKHPIAVKFVHEKGTFIYDVILKALLERPGMQRPALDIMADMLRDTLGEKESAHRVEKPATTHPPPSIYTWNILLAGCLFSREKELGNKIAHMMRSRGVSPNAVTWNTLISGYAGLQDANRTVKALQGLESSGYEADMYTIRGFSRLANRERALKALEKKIELSEVKRAAFRAAELREGLAVEHTNSVPQDETGGTTEEEDKLRKRPDKRPRQGRQSIAELDVRPDDPLLEDFLDSIPLDEVVQKQAPGWMKSEGAARPFSFRFRRIG
ncbi:pentatricopeptide repeat protein [Colletotrichum karsti]|uniref:Pentatricopeptide repeat protein n=1 Tax=Colletotrichum karsti TaxID=1095194 RepID=A0A9P6IGA8_9PEZI|nr:pentatricopeptide repeat protein [Colletotrichum karsti]KAF9882364.1 pentatricopeptide repeat protein [Colletotrichum karsti]